jgi:hypothetical protein
MKMGILRFLPHNLGAIVGIVYVYGAILGIIGFAWSWFSDYDLPRLEWWQFVLAPLAIGVVALAVEALGTFVASGFTFGHTESRSRLMAGKVAFVLLLLALLVGLPMYQISHQ